MGTRVPYHAVQARAQLWCWSYLCFNREKASCLPSSPGYLAPQLPGVDPLWLPYSCRVLGLQIHAPTSNPTWFWCPGLPSMVAIWWLPYSCRVLGLQVHAPTSNPTWFWRPDFKLAWQVLNLLPFHSSHTPFNGGISLINKPFPCDLF